MTHCRSCGHTVKKFFSLGKMPLANAFLHKKDFKSEKLYDLSVGFCPQCYLVQLMKTIDPKILFGNYLYFSSATKTIVEHSKMTATHLIDTLKLNSHSTVIEIGSNDGVHLRFYKKLGMQVLGVDPAVNVANIANNSGIPTVAEFFSNAFAQKLKTQGYLADLIYGANVTAHIPNILDFAHGIKSLLKVRGVAVFESPYIGGLLENKFDTIYHEHVFYYSLISLQNLFAKANLAIFDLEFVHMQGGSLRIYVSHIGAYKTEPRVSTLAEKEKKQGFDTFMTYKSMDKNIRQLRKELITLLQTLKSQHKRIAVYGAPAKGVILLNYFNIKQYLDFIVDKSIVKQGLYVPGVHMEIYSLEKIKKNMPDYLLILPWNISEEIIKSMDTYRCNGGKFIIPVPKILII